jgi:hypothetical protein
VPDGVRHDLVDREDEAFQPAPVQPGGGRTPGDVVPRPGDGVAVERLPEQFGFPAWITHRTLPV